MSIANNARKRAIVVPIVVALTALMLMPSGAVARKSLFLDILSLVNKLGEKTCQ